MGNSFSCISANAEKGEKSESRKPLWKTLFRRDSHKRIGSEADKLDIRNGRQQGCNQELKVEDIESYDYLPKVAAPIPKKPHYDIQAPPSNVTLPRAVAWSIDFGRPKIVKTEANKQHDQDQPNPPAKSPNFIGCGDIQQKSENEADGVPEPEPMRKDDTDDEEWEPIGRVKLHEHYEWDGDEWIPCSTETENTESDEDDDESKKAEMYRAIASALELVLERVEFAHHDIKTTKEEEGEDLTPPEVEGYIHSGPGILKATKFGGVSTEARCVTWEVNVKPSGADEPILDQITESFARERSKLLLKRTPQEHQRQRTARLAKQWYMDYFSKYVEPKKHRSMLPVPVKSCKQDTQASGLKVPTARCYKPISIANGCRIPVLIKPKPVKKQVHVPFEEAPLKQAPPIPLDTKTIVRRTDGTLIWPERLEDIDSAAARAYFLEQFKNTPLFRQRQRKLRGGEKSWAHGLTPFQRWATINAGDSMTLTSSTNQRASKRNSMAKSRISTWRRTGPAVR